MQKTTGRRGWMEIKIDLEKAFDKLEWGFIRKVLSSFNFPKSWKDLILSCITSSRTSVLVNGGQLESFNPTMEAGLEEPRLIFLFYVWSTFQSLRHAMTKIGSLLLLLNRAQKSPMSCLQMTSSSFLEPIKSPLPPSKASWTIFAFNQYNPLTLLNPKFSSHQTHPPLPRPFFPITSALLKLAILVLTWPMHHSRPSKEDYFFL